MRIWDVPPGYLNRQSLLGEHRELHGLHSILVHRKTGYSRHPETRRWVGCRSGLVRRHALLLAEMQLRGYSDRSPLLARGRVRWPSVFVTPPAAQYAALAVKYRGRAPGRIALPRNAQELWAHHEYSVMARDVTVCRSLGRRVARMRRGGDLSRLADDLVALLRLDPPPGTLGDAIEQMWDRVSRAATADERRLAGRSFADLFAITRDLALRRPDPHLASSTALADLALFVPPVGGPSRTAGRR